MCVGARARVLHAALGEHGGILGRPAVVILEDDLEVSPWFWRWLKVREGEEGRGGGWNGEGAAGTREKEVLP